MRVPMGVISLRPSAFGGGCCVCISASPLRPINMPWWPTAVASDLDVESSLASVSFLMLHPRWCVVPSFVVVVF